MFEHQRPRWLRLAIVACAAWIALAAAATSAFAEQGPRPIWHVGEPYPLDELERAMAPKGPVRCPTVAKVRYKGDVIRYHSPVMVAVPFQPRLRAFEQIVAKVAIAHFGRAPKLIRHIGTYNCRRIAAYPTWMSEHGLANGIDIAAFEFGPATRAERAARPKAPAGAFRVRVLGDWRSERKADAAKRAFLHDLTRQLIAARGVFRVVLGPGYPGHENHLHLDCAPYRLVQVDLDPAPGTTEHNEGVHPGDPNME